MVWDRAVNSSYAVGFDGSGDYTNVNAAASIKGLTSYSVSVWAKPNALVSGGVYSIWFESINTDGTTARSMVFFENASGSYNNVANTVGVRFRASDGGSATTFSAGANVVSVGLWHHIVFVFDSVNDSHKIYVNGRLHGTSSAAVTGHDNTAPASVTLGVSGTSNSEYLNGEVDEFRIYNRVLTDAEVQSIYRNSSSPPTSGLVCYFPLDEGTGTTVTDSIGGLTGTLTNGPTWEPQVCPRLRSGRGTDESWGVAFDGTDDYIDLPTATFSNELTVSAWVKTDSVASGVRGIVGNASATGTAADFILELNRTAGKISFLRSPAAVSVVSSTSLVASVWYHVVGRISGASGNWTCKIFINGNEDASALDTNNPISTNAVLAIGRLGGFPAYFDGNIKDVRIYNSALSAADIAKLANNVPITATPVGHWKLDDGTGTTATDSSGNGNHGTLTNGPTWTGDIPQWFRPAIESSYAGSFDGSNDYIDVGSVSLGVSTAITISLWVKPTTLTSGEYYSWFSAGGYIPGGCVFQRAGDAHKLRFAWNASQIFDGPLFTTAGSWTHLAVTATGTSITFYVNGTPTTGTRVGGAASFSISEPKDYELGRRCDSNNQYINGLIDDLPIYNIALPAAAIADAAAGYLVRAGLVSRYKLDGNANDSYGSNHGTPQGGVSYSSAVPATIAKRPRRSGLPFA